MPESNKTLADSVLISDYGGVSWNGEVAYTKSLQGVVGRGEVFEVLVEIGLDREEF